MSVLIFFLFFFTATATTEIYTLSLHDALPICTDIIERRRRRASSIRSTSSSSSVCGLCCTGFPKRFPAARNSASRLARSEEHTSELQSHSDLVCRLLLEKKKKKKKII